MINIGGKEFKTTEDIKDKLQSKFVKHYRKTF